MSRRRSSTPRRVARSRGRARRVAPARPGLTPGYWKTEGDDDAFQDGWLCSGDIAYFDADGDYYIVDRSKDMYISGGENVYPPKSRT